MPYVQAKREAELIAPRARERGMPIVFAYPCFCYGPGDVYESSSDLLAGFLAGSLPAYINGGHNAMDVRDAADRLILAMERGSIGERYLLGGENITFEQLFGLLTYVTGRRGPRVKLAPALARALASAADRVAREPPLTLQMALMSQRRWYYDDGRARAELGYTSLAPAADAARRGHWHSRAESADLHRLLCRARQRAVWTKGTFHGLQTPDTFRGSATRGARTE